MTHPSLLAALWRTGALRTLDHALAQSRRRLDPDTPDTGLAAAALVSLAVSAGHAGFDPADPQRLVDGRPACAPPAALRPALPASRGGAHPRTALPPAPHSPPPANPPALHPLPPHRPRPHPPPTCHPRLRAHPHRHTPHSTPDT